MLSFNQSAWLYLGFIFPVLYWMRYKWPGRGGVVVFSYGIWQGSSLMPKSSLSRLFIHISTICYTLGAALLIAALAGPEIQQRQEVHLNAGADIIIVLDQSPSMAAIDSPPLNRFEVAREMIKQFIINRSGDSIGIVGFGRQAVLRSPPTTDYAWLDKQLARVEVGQMGDGTAIGMGLAVAVLHLSSSNVERKMILLITDGDENYGEIKPETAAKMAASKDIQIYGVGIGSEGEVPIEINSSLNGQKTQGTIITRFNEEQLRQLSAITGGEYWHAQTPGAMEIVFRSIDSLESVERQIHVRVVSKPLYRGFTLAGLLLIFLVYVINRLFLGLTP